jgi:TATA-binding protein-associated factor Taf7
MGKRLNIMDDSVLLDEKMYLATLVDLPCLIEAQKTLDFRTFYKSTDVSQMLYIHNKHLENFSQLSADQVLDFAKGFYPDEHDTDFYHNLYKRGELGKTLEEAKKSQDFR